MDIAQLSSSRSRSRRRRPKPKSGGSILDSIKPTAITCVSGPNLDLVKMVDDVIGLIKRTNKVVVKQLEREITHISMHSGCNKMPTTRFQQLVSNSEKKEKERILASIKRGENFKRFKMDVLGLVNRHSAMDDTEIDAKRMMVDNFLRIAAQYCDIRTTSDARPILEADCDMCDDADISTIDDGSYYCRNCGYTWAVIVKYGSVSVEDDRVKSVGGYETKENFRKVLNKFQGIHSNIPDRDKVFRELDKFFFRETGHNRAWFIKQKQNKDGSKGNYNKESLLRALEETNNASLYRDVNTIASELWGWKCRDLSLHQDAIMLSYDKFVRHFLIMFPKHPFPSNDFFLYVFINKVMLERKEGMIKRGELKIIKSDTILREHIDRFQQVCTSLSVSDESWLFYLEIKW